jgi:hypothetical protein
VKLKSIAVGSVLISTSQVFTQLVFTQLLLAEGDAGANTHLAGYGEIDFEGAAQTANSVATNSFNPRMRQASLEVDRTDLGLHFLAGQSWSLKAPSKVGIDPRGVDAPGVIDFESVPGFIAARQPGVRVWQDFGPEFKLALSAENAATSFVGGNVPLVGTPAVGPQGVLNPNLPARHRRERDRHPSGCRGRRTRLRPSARAVKEKGGVSLFVVPTHRERPHSMMVFIQRPCSRSAGARPSLRRFA